MAGLREVPLDSGALRFAGAIGLRRGQGYVRPMRLPPEQLDLFDSGLISMASAPAGVRLAFTSDTRTLELELEQMMPPESPFPAVYDLLADGALAGQHTARGAGPHTLAFRELPRDTKQLELWLTQSAGVRVRALRIESGASLEPTVETRPRWITYGSSITHCLEADSPTRTWPAVAAQAAGLDLLALGYGGQCHFDPLVARMIRDQPADCISLKLGINVYGGGSFNERSFAASVHGFIETVRDGHPDVPLVVISPIVYPAGEDVPGPGGLSISQMRDILADLVERRRKRGDAKLGYLSGLELFDRADLANLPDGLHPNSAGYLRIGERFAALQLAPGAPLRPS